MSILCVEVEMFEAYPNGQKGRGDVNKRPPYPSDVSDAQWVILEPLVPACLPGGRPEVHSRREIISGILYVLRSGCAWRMMPHDLPPWETVFYYYSHWQEDGTWEKLHDRLRGELRQALGKEPFEGRTSLTKLRNG
jgi:transposase